MYEGLFGVNVRKSFIHSFVVQKLLVERTKGQPAVKDNTWKLYLDWRMPYFGVSSHRLLEECKELVVTPKYKKELGTMVHPIDFGNVDQVRRYKSPHQLRVDAPSHKFVNGRLIPMWDHETLLEYAHPQHLRNQDSIREFLLWVGYSDHNVAFETMYRKFTFGEIKVPKEVLENMEHVNPGCFGTGHEPIPQSSQWDVKGKKGAESWRGMTRHSGGLY